MEYTVDDIEVLTPIEAVQKRPKMWAEWRARTSFVALVSSVVREFIHAVAWTDRDQRILRVETTQRDVTFEYMGSSLFAHPEALLTHLRFHPECFVGEVDTDFRAFVNRGERGGAHGFMVANALTERVDVLLDDGVIRHRASFECGQLVDETKDSSSGSQCCRIRIVPGSDLLDDIAINPEDVRTSLRGLAVSCPGFELRYHDRESGVSGEFLYPEGGPDRLRELAEPKMQSDPVCFEAHRFRGEHAFFFNGDRTPALDGLHLVVSWTGEGPAVSELIVNGEPQRRGADHIRDISDRAASELVGTIFPGDVSRTALCRGVSFVLVLESKRFACWDDEHANRLVDHAATAVYRAMSRVLRDLHGSNPEIAESIKAT